MTLRLIYLPGGDAFIDDGDTAARLSDITKLSNYNPTGDAEGMTKFHQRHGEFGFFAAPLTEVLALLEPEPEPAPPTEEELKEHSRADAERTERLLFRSA